MRLLGTRSAKASALTVMPIGFKNSSLRISPGWASGTCRFLRAIVLLLMNKGCRIICELMRSALNCRERSSAKMKLSSSNSVSKKRACYLDNDVAGLAIVSVAARAEHKTTMKLPKNIALAAIVALGRFCRRLRGAADDYHDRHFHDC